MKEDYVSFETAKLLKENGFDEDIDLWYDENGEMFIHPKYDIGCNWRVKQGIKIYQCSTLQMAMKWLRDIFHLEIYPFHDAIQENNDWWYRIERHSKGCSLLEHESNVIYKTYEEACEDAIKYCLKNLI